MANLPPEQPEAQPEDKSRERQGIFILALAAFFFSLFALAGKAVSPEISSAQMILIRSMIILPVLVIWALQQGHPLVGKRWLLLLVRGFLGTTGLFTFFVALKNIPLADTVLIFQAHPLLVAVLAPLFLKEKNRLIHWLLLCISFTGVYMVVGPTGAGSWTGRLSALACCVIASFVYILVRYLRRSERTLTIAISFPAVSVVIFGSAFLLRAWGVEGMDHWGCDWMAPTTRDWYFLVGMALAATLGQVLLTLGLGRVPAARGTAISNLQIGFALLYGILFFSEIPGWITCVGMVIIVSAQLLLAFTHCERMGRSTNS